MVTQGHTMVRLQYTMVAQCTMTVFNIVHSVYLFYDSVYLFYVIWTDTSENKLFVIVFVIDASNVPWYGHILP